MGWHLERRRSKRSDGGDPNQPDQHVLRVERLDEKRRACLLPHSGAYGRDRVRAAARRPPTHPYDLPRSDERLRREARGQMKKLLAVGVMIVSISPSGLSAHRLD